VDWVSLWIGIGAAHAVMLSVFAGVAARRRSGHAWLAALFAILAIVVTAILVTHRTEGIVESVALVIEGAAAWAVGPVLYAYMRDAIDRPLAPAELGWHFGICAALSVTYILALMMTPWPSVQWAVVPYEIGYTALSALAFGRGRARRAVSARGTFWPLAALTLMGAIHAGQVLRFFAPRAAEDVVPLLGALGASILLLAVLVSQAQRIAGPRYARSALTREELERIYAALTRALDGPPALYLNLDLNLAQLSATVEAPAHHASQAISEIGGGSFYDLLTRRRVEDAQRRLLDPRNANVAVEALGMESGFRSRSAFYAAFKAATGMTPAEFRRRGGSIVSGTAG
jgi:AraC-like DNA-binding protein